MSPTRARRADALRRALIAAALCAGLGACTTTKSTGLSVTEAPAPNLRGAKDIDAAMLARIANATGRNAGAGGETESLYRQAAKSKPNAAEPRIRLGEVLLKKNDLDGAEGSFREAVTLEPRNMDGWIGLTQVLLARQNTTEALSTLNNALTHDPANVRALNAKGVILDKEGRHDEAQAVYRQALKTDPRSKMVRNNLGLSLALSGRNQEGQTILKALAEEPDATDEHRESLAFAQRK